MRSRLAFTLVVAVVALFASGARHAHAAGRERIAIGVFNVTGEPIAEEQRAKLRTSLRGGLAAGFDLVSDAEVEHAIAERGVTGCDTVTCLRSIGELVMVRRVVKATIEVIGTSHFATTLELIDLGEGKTIATASDDCTACNMKEVNDGLSNAAAALKMQLEPPASAPPSPTGPPLGETTPPHHGLYLGLGATSTTLFVGSVGLLAVAAAYHGKSSCDSSLPAGERCPTRYNGTPGIVIGAVGAPLFAAAAVVLAYRAWKSPPSKVALIPSVGPGAAGLDLRIRF